MARLRALDNVRQVGLQRFRSQSPEGVVSTERHDQDLDVALHRPVQTFEAACGRIAGNAGVDHLVIETRILETPL